MNSILNIEVSCFKNYDTPANPKQVNLLSWLQSEKYNNEVEHIRAIEDKKERNELKAELPAITPSGLFTYRAEKNLIKHSGFIQFDIDEKGNEGITNYMELKNHICNIQNVAYCGLSVSGKGFWGLIPIEHRDKHKLHFKALELMFKRFNITIDPSCKDVSRLRGYSFDPYGYFNHKAKLFSSVYTEPVKSIQAKHQYSTSKHSQNKIDIAVKLILNAPDGEKHNTLLKAAKLMGGYIAGGEINEEEAVIALEEAIQNRNIDSFEAAQKTIQSGIMHGKKNPIEVSYRFKKMQSVTSIKRTPIIEQFSIIQPAAEVKQIESIEFTNATIKSKTPNSIGYINETGELFIETPCANTFTIYMSIEHYNKRLCLPSFENKQKINFENMDTVFIDPKTLTINLK